MSTDTIVWSPLRHTEGSVQVNDRAWPPGCPVHASVRGVPRWISNPSALRNLLTDAVFAAPVPDL